MGEKQIWIGHYSSSHKILLVGEGDFSFSACLARAFRSATNMVATTFESEDTLLKEHRSSEAHVDELQRRGCRVLHEVDVHDMDQHPTLMFMKFDIIVFNFPHAGHDYWLCERNNELIRRHRGLLEAFFRSASGMLGEGGEIHVSHRDDYPYDKWKLKELAKKAGLVLKEKVWFEKSDYPGYHQKRGGGIASNKTFPLKECYTFKFSLKHETSVLDSEEATSKLQRKLEELHLPQHKIFLPNHIHVPESERTKLTFGSFGAADFVNGPETDKSSHIMSGCGFRVSISNSVRKTIPDIKEITGNHSEEEIYAMLKSCYMDPNETAQKLLFQDPFHEVKRKRDKRKEKKLNNIESAESPWRPGFHGREDAGDGGKSAPGVAPSLAVSRKTKNKQRSLVTSSRPIIVDGPTNVADGWPPVVLPSHLSGWELGTSADGWSDAHPSHLSGWELGTSADGWSDAHPSHLSNGWSDVHPSHLSDEWYDVHPSHLSDGWSDVHGAPLPTGWEL